MAQTTTAVNACNIVIALDTDAGVLVDVSGTANTINLEFTINAAEGYTFDGDFPIRKTCGKDMTGSFTCVWSTTADESWDLVKGWYHVYDGAARTLRIDVPSTAGGNDRYEGEVVLLSYSHEMTADEAGPIMVECEIASDGEFLLLEIGT